MKGFINAIFIIEIMKKLGIELKTNDIVSPKELYDVLKEKKRKDQIKSSYDKAVEQNSEALRKLED